MIFVDDQPINVTHFPDGTSQVWKLPETMLTPKRVIVRWDFESEGELIHLAQLKDLLDSNEVMATLHMPYLPYARQDKVVENDKTFALHTFAKLINTMHFDQVEAYDPHSEVARDVIRHFKPWLPIHEIQAAFDELYTIGSEKPLVCYPDGGAVRKYGPMMALSFVYGVKERNQETGVIGDYRLEVGSHPIEGRDILIVDDICDRGGTFTRLAKLLKDGGAKDIHLYVSHGLFTAGTQILRDAGINRIFTKRGELHV